jgi:hypothetical protein
MRIEMSLDLEQTRLLALAREERDSARLMELISEVLERFDRNADRHELTEVLREQCA